MSRKARKHSADIPSVIAPFMKRATDAADLVMQSHDPEGPHQLRVGLRKTRTALSIFGGDRPQVRRMRDEARDIASVVGALRDLDVVRLEILAPFRADHPNATGFEKLDKALLAAASDARRSVRAMLETGRFEEWSKDVSTWLRDQAGRPAGPRADKALKRRFRKAQGLGWRFVALDVAHRHEFRKELKKLRYTLDCGAWAQDGPSRKTFVKRLKALQVTLGSMNDAAAAETILTEISRQGAIEERAAAGQIVACLTTRSGPELARTATMWTKFEALWPPKL